MHLARFNPVRFAHLPTPLEPLPRLTAALSTSPGGGPELWIKRDDCTGLAGGGNKTRKLEFLLGDALANDADTLVTQGAVQSNHVRQTAAAAAKFGLKCEVILEARTGSNAVDYTQSGNVLLDELLGANIRHVPGGTDMNAALAEVAAEVAEAGGRPYVIPGGGSNVIGALGYVECAMELVSQANDIGLEIDRIVTATGSAGTHAGLVAGIAMLGADIPILGIGVRAPKDVQEANVFKLAQDTAELLGHRERVTRDMVAADCDYVGAGYGLVDDAVIEALKLAARTDAILLDPVYTGKAMKGLIALAQKGAFDGETVVFLHTGGAQGLFGYQSVLDGEALAMTDEASERTSLVLGVLGGMGPAATLDFLTNLQAFTPAKGDSDHIRVLMDLNPKVPDRNMTGTQAGVVLAEMAGALAGAGAQVLAMPCNTAHAHADLIQRASGLPLIDLIGEGAKAARLSGARRVGVLGTKGALRLYREYLAAQALGLVSLSPERQEEFMATIYRIKAGDLETARREMIGYAGDLVASGAEAVIAGCTEAPLVMGPSDLKVAFIDPGELLARRCVAVCLGLEPVPATLSD